MQKVYAKNPAEIILDNPSKPKKGSSKSSKKSKSKPGKDPRRVAAGRKAWKTRQRKQNKKTMSKRTNPKSVAETGFNMYKKFGAAALATMLTLGVTGWGLRKYGSNLPAWATNYAPIVVPGIVGIGIATKAKKSNAALQGVAGGMVFNSAQEALRKVLPADITNQSLSDAIGYSNDRMLGNVAEGSIIVTPNGETKEVVNGKLVNAMPAQAALPAAKPQRKAPASRGKMQTVSFEEGENF